MPTKFRDEEMKLGGWRRFLGGCRAMLIGDDGIWGRVGRIDRQDRVLSRTPGGREDLSDVKGLCVGDWVRNGIVQRVW